MPTARRSLRVFHQCVFGLLMVVMVVVVILATSVQLVVEVTALVLDTPRLRLDPHELIGIVGLFLNVLIALELFAILEVLLLEHSVHVQFVVAVALIAATREVLIIDYHSVSALKLVGLATLILSLTVGYYLIKQQETSSAETGRQPDD